MFQRREWSREHLPHALLPDWPLRYDAAAPRFASGIPDFSSNNMGWASNGVEFRPLPGEKFVPVSNDPAHPHCGNRISPKCGNQILPPIGDTKNPILQPWAATQMQKTNDEILGGKESFEAMSRCWPGAGAGHDVAYGGTHAILADPEGGHHSLFARDQYPPYLFKRAAHQEPAADWSWANPSAIMKAMSLSSTPSA